MSRWLSSGLLTLVVLLAGTTAYYVSKATVLERQLSQVSRQDAQSIASPTVADAESSDSTSSSEPTASTTPSHAETATAAPPPANLSASDRLAIPTEVYTVAGGDTLYPIGLKYNLAWERIAEANGLTEPYVLQIGQQLVIPTVDAAENVYEVRLTTEPGRAQTMQTQVDAGDATWRRDPVATVQAEHQGLFGLTDGDDFRLSSQDAERGTAQVVATRLVDGQAKSYTIDLRQPVQTGEGGIWTIERIGPKE